MAKQKINPKKKKVKVVIDPQTKIDATWLKAIPGLGNFKRDKLTSFTAASIDVKHSLITEWQGDKSITDNQKESLLGSIDLLEITKDNTAILSSLGKEGVRNFKDLVKFDKKNLGELIAKNPDTPEKGNKAKELALDILKEAERKHPSAFFMNRLFENPEFVNIDTKLLRTPSKALKTFYTKNKEYNLLTEPIISAKTGQLNEKINHTGKVTPNLVKELTATQQALQLGRDSDLALLLYSNRITISKALDMSYTALMKATGRDSQSAIQIKSRAQAQHETAMNGLFAYMDIADPTLRNTIFSYEDLNQMIFAPCKIDWTAVQENESPTMYTPGTYDPQTCDTIMMGGGMRTICH